MSTFGTFVAGNPPPTFQDAPKKYSFREFTDAIREVETEGLSDEGRGAFGDYRVRTGWSTKRNKPTWKKCKPNKDEKGKKFPTNRNRELAAKGLTYQQGYDSYLTGKTGHEIFKSNPPCVPTAYGPYQIRPDYLADAAKHWCWHHKKNPPWKTRYPNPLPHETCINNKVFSEYVLICYMRWYAEDAYNVGLPFPLHPLQRKYTEKELEVMARIHNGGPNGHKYDSTKKYWNKVKAKLKDKGK
tara:strand:+ start:928 stop:1653 length:726 start_codon:yes stop_codon:yes gene_type:complete